MKKIFAILTLAICAGPVHAQYTTTSDDGFFIEPAVTYEIGDSSVNYPSPLSSSNGDSEGLGLGVRLGGHVSEMFVLAIDGRYNFLNFSDSTADYDADAEGMNWGPVVAVQMPDAGFRLWATYIVDGQLNPKKSGSLDVKFEDATGFRLGVGFHVAAVSLNLEYQELNYGSSTLESVGPFTTGTNFGSVENDVNSWIASVSFPIEI